MRRLLPCLLLLLPALAAAESPWRLGVAMGYGERSNPLLNSDDLPIVVDLDIACHNHNKEDQNNAPRRVAMKRPWSVRRRPLVCIETCWSFGCNTG